MKKQEHINKHKKVTGSTKIAPKEEQYESEKLKTPVGLYVETPSQRK